MKEVKAERPCRKLSRKNCAPNFGAPPFVWTKRFIVSPPPCLKIASLYRWLLRFWRPSSMHRARNGFAPPPAGKLYQGLYFDEPAAGRDPTEHDVTAANVARFEQTLGTKTAWVFFSNNWSESRKFPVATCDWVRGLGKVPYIRLMLRSDLEQNHAEKTFSLANILAGNLMTI